MASTKPSDSSTQPASSSISGYEFRGIKKDPGKRASEIKPTDNMKQMANDHKAIIISTVTSALKLINVISRSELPTMACWHLLRLSPTNGAIREILSLVRSCLLDMDMQLTDGKGNARVATVARLKGDKSNRDNRGRDLPTFKFVQVERAGDDNEKTSMAIASLYHTIYCYQNFFDLGPLDVTKAVSPQSLVSTRAATLIHELVRYVSCHHFVSIMEACQNSRIQMYAKVHRIPMFIDFEIVSSKETGWNAFFRPRDDEHDAQHEDARLAHIRETGDEQIELCYGMTNCKKLVRGIDGYAGAFFNADNWSCLFATAYFETCKGQA